MKGYLFRWRVHDQEVVIESVGSAKPRAVGGGQQMILTIIFHGGALNLNKDFYPSPSAKVLFNLDKRSHVAHKRIITTIAEFR